MASVGLDPSSTWITRMRAILPASALTDGDLVVEASPTQAAVSNQHKASTYDDPTYDPCSSAGASGNGASGGGCSAADTPPEATGRALVIGSLALLAAMLLRRRRLASR